MTKQFKNIEQAIRNKVVRKMEMYATDYVVVPPRNDGQLITDNKKMKLK